MTLGLKFKKNLKKGTCTEKTDVNLVPNRSPLFYHKEEEDQWEKEKMLITGILSFSNNVFFPFIK